MLDVAALAESAILGLDVLLDELSVDLILLMTELVGDRLLVIGLLGQAGPS